MKKFIITAVLVGSVSGAQAQSLDQVNQFGKNLVQETTQGYKCIGQKPPFQYALVTDNERNLAFSVRLGTNAFGLKTVCGKGEKNSVRLSQSIKNNAAVITVSVGWRTNSILPTQYSYYIPMTFQQGRATSFQYGALNGGGIATPFNP